MKTIRDWNAYVVRKRAMGERVDIDSIIVDYVTRYQSVKWFDIINYVYKKISEDYRSAEFDAYIGNAVLRLQNSGKLVQHDNYYSIGG